MAGDYVVSGQAPCLNYAMLNPWSRKLLTSFFLITTVGIVVYTVYAAFHYTSNVVLSRDEANFIILSSQKILAASSTRELIEAFFPSHGQHTLLGMQLVNMFTYFTFDALDRRIMNALGVVILCAAALLLPGLRKSKTEMLLLCATLMPLIVSPAHNVCIVNASCTGNHYFGIAMSVVSLYFFTKIAQKRSFLILAEIFMLLAIFSLPAALALIPVSFLVLLTNEANHKFKLAAIHMVLIVLTLAFHSYLTYPNTIFSFAQSAEQVPWAGTIKNAEMFVATFLVTIGSLFYWLADMGYGGVLMLIGLFVAIAVAVAIFKARRSVYGDDRSLPFYGVLLFLIMILIISFGRYFSLGASRYSVYAAFLCAMLLMLLFNRLDQSDDVMQSSRRLKILFCSSALSLIYFFTALHYHQPYLLSVEQRDRLCRNLWYSEGYACGVMISHQEATQLIKNAIDQGIYRVEKK